MPGQKGYNNLIQYIKELFGEYANWGLINKQLKQYDEEYGYTYSGIFKCLKYWLEDKHHDVTSLNGHIGIVASIYGEVKTYYKEKWQVNELNKNKSFKNDNGTKEIYIDTPQPKDNKTQKAIDIENFLKEVEANE